MPPMADLYVSDEWRPLFSPFWLSTGFRRFSVLTPFVSASSLSSARNPHSSLAESYLGVWMCFATERPPLLLSCLPVAKLVSWWLRLPNYLLLVCSYLLFFSHSNCVDDISFQVHTFLTYGLKVNVIIDHSLFFCFCHQVYFRRFHIQWDFFIALVVPVVLLDFGLDKYLVLVS